MPRSYSSDKSLMGVLWLRGLNLLSKWYNQLLCLFLGKKGQVLVFHEVSETFSNDTSCKIRLSTFNRIIERIESKKRYVGIEALIDGRDNNVVVVTFDDVPHSFYTEAYPILKEKQIPFTLFVAKKYVGVEGFLSADEIKILDKDPLCTIGAHTCNHARLRNEKESKQDIEESKRFLESLLGHEIKYLAFPYGRYDSVSTKNRNEAEVAGFKAAFSTIPTAVPVRFNRWFVPRIELIQ